MFFLRDDPFENVSVVQITTTFDRFRTNDRQNRSVLAAINLTHRLVLDLAEKNHGGGTKYYFIIINIIYARLKIEMMIPKVIVTSFFFHTTQKVCENKSKLIC